MDTHPVIMVVEDEASIRDFIVLNLERAGFQALEAESGEEALELIKSTTPDLVVLDLKLPGIDGYAVCKELHQSYPQVSVIMLTAKGQDWEKIMGLELGADDYMIKPFNPNELVARIRAVLRRTTPQAKEVEQEGDLTVSPATRTVTKRGVPISLTQREFDLLLYFIRHKDHVLSRDQILNSVWGMDYIGDPKTVDVHVRRLRAKLEDDPSAPQHLTTVWGIGYRWQGGSHD